MNPNVNGKLKNHFDDHFLLGNGDHGIMDGEKF